MSALWTSDEAQRATGGKARGEWTANGVSIDTRSLEKGDLFIALTGENRDGHEFVAGALAKGAAAAMVSNIPSDVGADARLLIVADTQGGLEALGDAARARANAKIIGVTGSAGKTTTKEMLRVMLSGLGSVSASAASYNNHWGVPLSLARMKRETDFGIFEIGMNHAGEIRGLVRYVRPHAAIITTIAPAHLEYFGTLDAIADAKAEIFEGLEPDGPAILNADIPQFERLKSRATKAGVTNIQTFGRASGADARLIASEAYGDRQMVTAEIGGKRLTFAIGAAGAHIASNALAALLGARGLGVDPAVAARGLSGFSAMKGRGSRFSADGVDIIDESYNANPASMTATLRLLAETSAKGRRIAVLGDMLELGPQAKDLHAALAKDVDANAIDLVFACGANMRALWDALLAGRRGAYAENSSALAAELCPRLRAGDVVLVKGSFGSRMSVIIDALKARGS